MSSLCCQKILQKHSLLQIFFLILHEEHRLNAQKCTEICLKSKAHVFSSTRIVFGARSHSHQNATRKIIWIRVAL